VPRKHTPARADIAAQHEVQELSLQELSLRGPEAYTQASLPDLPAQSDAESVLHQETSAVVVWLQMRTLWLHQLTCLTVQSMMTPSP